MAGFYLGNGNCEKIDSPIENCEIENSQKICLKCEPGHLLDIENKKCIEVPDIDNCSTYSNMEC